MKRLSLLDLPILLLLGALVFAIGCPTDNVTQTPLTQTPPVSSTPPQAVISGLLKGTVGSVVSLDATKSANVSGTVTWTVKNPAGATVTTTTSNTVAPNLTAGIVMFTPAVVGTYTVTMTVSGSTVTKSVAVSALPTPPTVTLRAENPIIATTDPRTFTIPAVAYAVNPSTATKTWSIKSTTCNDPSTITPAGVLTVPTVYGTDCQTTVKLAATNSAGTGADTVVIFIKALPTTGITGGGGGSL